MPKFLTMFQRNRYAIAPAPPCDRWFIVYRVQLPTISARDEARQNNLIVGFGSIVRQNVVMARVLSGGMTSMFEYPLISGKSLK
ncbi:MAG: hypothetical protein AB3A66_16150 [Nodularia sp. CChRGM 3473]